MTLVFAAGHDELDVLGDDDVSLDVAGRGNV
jgi:hypothetical protein